MNTYKAYPALEPDSQIATYNNPKQIQSAYENLGKIEVVCSDLFAKKTDTTRCDSTSVFLAAENKAKEIGGNALLITQYENANTFKSAFAASSYGYSLHADILKVFPDSLYINTEKEDNHGKGTWDLRLSLPYMNHFRLKPDGENNVSSAGFMGFAAGFDYYHSNDQYLTVILADGVQDDIFPIRFVPFYGEVESCYSIFTGVTNNHRFKFLSLGYGLSFAYNRWLHKYYGDYDMDTDPDYIPPDKKYTDYTLGLMFTTYWLSKGPFSVGVIYRPTFLRLNTSPTFKYEHLISIDFAWRIRLKTGEK